MFGSKTTRLMSDIDRALYKGRQVVAFKAKKEEDLIDYQKNAINFYENNFSKKQVLSIWKKELKF